MTQSRFDRRWVLGLATAPAVRQDATLDDVAYAAMDAEIRKLESVHDGGSPDWTTVVEEGGRLIAAGHKDVPTVCRVALGLCMIDGLAGLEAGTSLLADLVATQWEVLSPPLRRATARGRAVEWLADHVLRRLAATAACDTSLPGVVALRAAAERLDAALVEKLGVDGTPWRKVVRRVAQMESSVPVAKAPPEPAEVSDLSTGHSHAGASAASPAGDDAIPRTTSPPVAPDTSEAPVPTGPVAVPLPSPARSPDLTEDTDPQRAPVRIAEALGRTARALRAAAPSDPEPYRLARVAAWLTLRGEPPSRDGRTMLPPPSGRVRSRLIELETQRRFDLLLDAAEAAFLETPLFLDAQRVVAVCLRELGPTWLASRHAVEHEVRGLVARLPGLPALVFRDGSPLADDSTCMWIATLTEDQDHGRGHSASGEAARPSSQDRDTPSLEGVTRSARRLAAEGRIAEAVEHLVAAGRATASAREQSVLLLETAALCKGAGRKEMAAALLSRLDEDLTTRPASWWVPELSARVVAELLGCTDTRQTASPVASGAPDVNPAARRLFERLCHLDAAAAARLDLRSA